MAKVTARVFKSGNSQAVRIPKEFHIEATEVEIQKRGDTLVMRAKRRSWARLLDSLGKFSSDFMEYGREQPGHQRRARVFR
jgi:antitoxin VapB